LIQKWINQGARNNSCQNRCNSTVFTYSGAVRPTLESKCTGCHSGTAPSGGVNLSDYSNTRTWALNGRLYGSIAHQSGFSPMPKNSAKLSDCEIQQVQQWIQAGAQNN
jgi:mono/diheme cytochrome c family protein